MPLQQTRVMLQESTSCKIAPEPCLPACLTFLAFGNLSHALLATCAYNRLLLARSPVVFTNLYPLFFCFSHVHFHSVLPVTEACNA